MNEMNDCVGLLLAAGMRQVAVNEKHRLLLSTIQFNRVHAVSKVKNSSQALASKIAVRHRDDSKLSNLKPRAN